MKVIVQPMSSSEKRHLFFLKKQPKSTCVGNIIWGTNNQYISRGFAFTKCPVMTQLGGGVNRQ